ncbi:MAG: radical SAM family heme chaperone HemW [Clostridia bacterium]|nr:radical SAM family heme chaperone HemW [Clostridia bacterium]
MRKELSIYVHIPFCERKCNYCAFVSYCVGEKEKDEYIDDLCKEIAKRKCDGVVKTIYIGGGTPSILTSKQIEKVVGAIYDTFDVYDNAEFTIEANPNSITEELLATWKKLRVNRLSIGVQSLKDKSLQKIGRIHTKVEALEKIKMARKCFDNVSADLIVGLENEDGKDLCRYAGQLLDLGVKHISCYLLEVYENTKLFKDVEEKKYKLPNDEQTISAFNKLANYLQDKGMERYEISNFAYPSYESKHNLNYWARGEYLGFGVSAHSFDGKGRTANADNFSDYKAGKTFKEEITPKEEIEEIIMLGFRCKLGVDKKKLQTLGYDITENAYYSDYLKQGILTEKENKIFLNPVFYHISNGIIANLLP